MTSPIPDETERPSASSHLRRVELSLAVAIFVTVFATSSRLARLPLQSLIKDELGLPPETMAQFFAVAGLGWYLKPIAGVLSDQVRLRGTRRKHYLMLSAVSGAFVWSLSALGPLRIELLLAAMVLLNVVAVLGNTVAGGLLVDQARQHRATCKLTSIRVIAMNTGSLIAGPLGGWLAGRAFPLTCATGAAFMLTMLVTVALLLPPDLAPSGGDRPLRDRLRDALAQLRRRRMWSVALFTVAFYGAPGFQSLFYYHQRDQLEFSDQTIGLLAALNCLGGMVGAGCYAYLGRRLALGRSIVIGISLCCAATFTYLAYCSLDAALLIEPVAGFCFVLGVMPIQELAVRASPPRHEALGFAFILSMGNAAISLSDVLGTWIADAFGLCVRHLIVINITAVAASSALLVLVPLSLLTAESSSDD